MEYDTDDIGSVLHAVFGFCCGAAIDTVVRATAGEIVPVTGSGVRPTSRLGNSTLHVKLASAETLGVVTMRRKVGTPPAAWR